MRNIMNQLLQILTQDSTTVLLALVAFTLLFLTIRSNRKPSRKFPPGPRFRWPILGNLPSLDPKAPSRTLNQLALKYGPVYHLQFGSFPVVVLNDYESVRQAFLRQGEEFDDRPRLLIFEMVNPDRGLITAHSNLAQRVRRRFSLSALRDLGMGKSRLEEQVVEEIQRLCNVISKHEGKEFAPFRLLDMVTCNVVCCLVFGHGFDYDDPKLMRILDFLTGIFTETSFTGLANFVPWMKYLPFSGLRNVTVLIDQIRAFYLEMIKKARDNYTRGDPRTFIDMYFDNQERIHKEDPDIAEWFDDGDLEACIADLFAAGTETSSTTLKWGLLYMVLQPDIQEKIHAELDSEVGRNRMPTLKDRPRLPYTEATLLEMQRIGSITPLGVPRAATFDTKLYGYDIEQGTMVMPNLWAVHHDERIWKEAESFKPERFLDSDGKLNRREELIPFAIGKRKCLGEQLALMELFLIFTHLLHKFSFRLPEGAQPSLEPEMGATLVPQEYKLVAVTR
ncbi:cytochrome P450 2U1-like [Amphiura filiformis]|uniref:cytochrome P450 2U1-like n=1 Tax=Amphiura filiformis TaxID=82378 RepID=UPI003B21EFFE